MPSSKPSSSSRSGKRKSEQIPVPENHFKLMSGRTGQSIGRSIFLEPILESPTEGELSMCEAFLALCNWSVAFALTVNCPLSTAKVSLVFEPFLTMNVK